MTCANPGSARADSSITGRDFELASGKAQPHGDETVTPMAGVAQALRDGRTQQPGLLDALSGMADTVAAIDGVVTERATISGPEFRPLRQFLQIISDAAKLASGAGDAATDAQASADVAGDPAFAGANHMAVAGGGALRTRDDAIKALDKVCEWIELNEPTNPAPLLIRRAQRLMSKNFMDIIRDLVPDGVDQSAKLAGVPNDQY